MRARAFEVLLMLSVVAAGAACDKNQASSGGEAPSASASASSSASASAPSASASASAGAADAEAQPDGAALVEEEDKLTDELQTHQRHQQRGFAGFVIMAVESLGLDADRLAAVEKVRKEFHQKTKPLREANQAVMGTLADGIAAGSIDKAKVDAGVAKAATAAGQVPAATADVLNQLHAALKPEERTALVDKVDAQWSVWKDYNSGDQSTADTKPHGHLAHFAKEFGLTSDQVDKVKSNLDASKDPKKSFDPAAAEAYIKAFDTAFTADAFDAKKLPALTAENSRLVSWGAERTARFYEAVAPVLTPDQRPKVADKVRQRAGEKDKDNAPASGTKEKP